MIYVYEGVVKDNTIVLDNPVRLPEGAKVEVRIEIPPVMGEKKPSRQEIYDALMKRRTAYEGRRIGIDEIIEEEKQDREERFDHWLFPER
jgi:hypothetical protein